MTMAKDEVFQVRIAVVNDGTLRVEPFKPGTGLGPWTGSQHNTIAGAILEAEGLLLEEWCREHNR